MPIHPMYIVFHAMWFWAVSIDAMLEDLAVATGQKPAPVLVLIRGGRV